MSIAHSYDALGSLVRTTQTSTSGVWRAQSSVSRYALEPDGSVWSRDFSVASCSDPVLSALTNRTDRKFYPLSQSERAHVVSYDLRGNATHETESFDRAAARSESSTLVPWAANPSLSVALAGLTVEVVDFASVTNRFEYDSLGHRIAATDGRGNATAFTFDSFGRLASRTDAATNTTTFIYDAAGRTISVIDALGNATYTAYDAASRKIAEWGATYPAVYAYDAYGRTVALATTRDERAGLSWNAVPDLSDPPAEWDVTRWLYEEATGLMTNKVYADGKGPSYAYSAEGRLARRTWARGVTTEYAYDEFDDLLAKTYSDETPAVALSYDGIGRLLSAVCEGVSTNLYSYGPFGDLTNEVQNGTILARSFDAFGRPTGYVIGNGEDPGSAVSYAYDADGRFSAVSSGTNTFSYSYLPGSSFVSGMTANTGHSWERVYEPNRDLIVTIHNKYGDRTISRFDYTNDEIGRRIARVDSGEAFSELAFERYTYNKHSEVIGTQRFYGSDITDVSRPIPGWAFFYGYDPIGNRTNSMENINNVQVTKTYEANAVNQYETIQALSGYAQNTKIVNLEYDDDGNMTFDGRFRLFWNAENRIIRAEEVDVMDDILPIVISYAYDHAQRMVFKAIIGTNIHARTQLWDDYNIIRETDNGVSTLNIWGYDLTGTLHEGGGVGGLLAVMKANGLQVSLFDANGNVSAYIDGDGEISASYEYSPFGEVSSSGKEKFSHQYSTKPYCNTMLAYEYPFRLFSPSLGRWFSRDPLGEAGGMNLSCLTSNNPFKFFDALGFKPSVPACDRKKSCIDNISLLEKGLSLTFSRFEEFFNPLYIEEAINDSLLPKERQYKKGRSDLRGREAWNGHVSAYEGSLQHDKNCAEIIMEQLKNGECKCCDPGMLGHALDLVSELFAIYDANPPTLPVDEFSPLPVLPTFPTINLNVAVEGPSFWKRNGLRFVGGVATAATVVLIFVPFDGPVGETACGSIAVSAFARAAQTTIPVMLQFSPALAH